MNISPLFLKAAISRGCGLAILFFLLSCAQAGSPDVVGQQIAAPAGSAVANGNVGAGNIIVQMVRDPLLLSKFPTMTRLQLSISGPAGTAGIPLQFDMPLNGSAMPITLPTGVMLTYIFDAFDAGGGYLGTGRSTLALTSNQAPIIPVNMAPVAAATVYVNPLSTLPAAGSALLTVHVVQESTQQNVIAINVSIGASGTQSAWTDNYGNVSFTTGSPPWDIHVVGSNAAVSVLGYSGSSITIPFPDRNPITAQVQVNAPIGATLAAGQQVDLYFTDGMTVNSMLGVTADGAALRRSAAPIAPMRGLIGVSAIINNPLDLSPKPDHGLSFVTATAHTAFTPLNISLPDPAIQPLLTPLLDSINVATAPTGMGAISQITEHLLANMPDGSFVVASHKDSAPLPGNQSNSSFWPIPTATNFVRYIQIQDSYAASSEAWQRAAAPLTGITFPALPTFLSPPHITAATAASISWLDAQPQIWQGWRLEIQQAANLWLVYSLVDTGTHLWTTPTLPAGVVSPLQVGTPAQAIIHEYTLDPTQGFNPLLPDLWYLPRMLTDRVSSASFAFTP